MGCEHHLSHIHRANSVDARTDQASCPVSLCCISHTRDIPLVFPTKSWLLGSREGPPSKAWSSSADHSVLGDFMTLSNPGPDSVCLGELGQKRHPCTAAAATCCQILGVCTTVWCVWGLLTACPDVMQRGTLWRQVIICQDRTEPAS